MSSKLQSVFLVALASALLGAGPALAAPSNTDADSVHARHLRQRGIALQSDSPRNADKANHEMLRPGPYDGPLLDRPDLRDGVRPVSQDTYKESQESDPRWNDSRREAPMPPRSHYQPDARDQSVTRVTPASSSDGRGRQMRPHRDRAPMSPDEWTQTGGHAAPFSYRR